MPATAATAKAATRSAYHHPKNWSAKRPRIATSPRVAPTTSTLRRPSRRDSAADVPFVLANHKGARTTAETPAETMATTLRSAQNACDQVVDGRAERDCIVVLTLDLASTQWLSYERADLGVVSQNLVFEADRKRFCRVLRESKSQSEPSPPSGAPIRASRSISPPKNSPSISTRSGTWSHPFVAAHGRLRANVGATRPPNCPWRRSTTPFEPEPRGNQWRCK